MAQHPDPQISTVCFHLRPSVLDSQQLAGLVVFGTFRPIGGKEVAKRGLAAGFQTWQNPPCPIYFLHLLGSLYYNYNHSNDSGATLDDLGSFILLCHFVTYLLPC